MRVTAPSPESMHACLACIVAVARIRGSMHACVVASRVARSSRRARSRISVMRRLCQSNVQTRSKGWANSSAPQSLQYVPRLHESTGSPLVRYAHQPPTSVTFSSRLNPTTLVGFSHRVRELSLKFEPHGWQSSRSPLWFSGEKDQRCT